MNKNQIRAINISFLIVIIITIIIFIISEDKYNKVINKIDSNVKIKPVKNVIVLGVDGVSSAAVFKNRLPSFDKIINSGAYSKYANNNGTIHSNSNWAGVLTSTSAQFQEQHWNNLQKTACENYIPLDISIEQKNILMKNEWWNNSDGMKRDSCFWNPLEAPPLTIMQYADILSSNKYRSKFYGLDNFMTEIVWQSHLSPEYASNAWTDNVVDNIFDNIKNNIEGDSNLDIKKVKNVLRGAKRNEMQKYNYLPGSFDYPVKVDQGSIDLFLNDVNNKSIGPVSFIYLNSTDLFAHMRGGNNAFYEQYVFGNVDNWLQDILEGLSKNNYDDYLLLFVSDHGHIGKQHTFYAPNELQVPLIMYQPGMKNYGTLKFDVSILNLTATIAKALNLPILKKYKNILDVEKTWWQYKPIIEPLLGTKI